MQAKMPNSEKLGSHLKPFSAASAVCFVPCAALAGNLCREAVVLIANAYSQMAKKC